MNTETYEIKPLKELTKEEKKSGKWIKLSEKQNSILEGMNRKERRNYLRENGFFKRGKWGWR